MKSIFLAILFVVLFPLIVISAEYKIPNLNPFNPGNPGPIGGTTSSTGQFTRLSVGPSVPTLPSSDGNVQIAQQGKICSPRGGDNQPICIQLTGGGVAQTLTFDPNSFATFIEFGDGSAGSEAIVLFSPKTILDWISFDLSQDVTIIQKDTSDNLQIGVTGLVNGNNKFGNMTLAVPSGKTILLSVNGVTIATLSGTALAMTSGTVIQVPPAHLATFPSCASGTEGSMATQDNSTAACANGATATSAGTTHCQIYCNGTNWKQTGL